MYKKVYRVGTLMIIVMALVTAILQGNGLTSVAAGADRQPQMTIIFLIGLLAVALYISGLLRGRMTQEKSLLYVIFLGMLMRVGYVLFMDKIGRAPRLNSAHQTSKSFSFVIVSMVFTSPSIGL